MLPENKNDLISGDLFPPSGDLVNSTDSPPKELEKADSLFHKEYISLQNDEIETKNSEESLVYFTAYNFYTELTKRARRFNKAFCRFNSLLLSSQRVLRNPSLGIKNSKEFNPFFYNLFLQKKSSDALSRTLVVQNAPTIEEAHLQYAYANGFLESFEYKSLLQQFHPSLLKQILEDKKYLDVVRRRAAGAEGAKQIVQAYYVPSAKREAWLLEIQEKIQEDINKIKGAP